MGVTAFIFAIQNGHKEIVELLLDRGANFDQANKMGVTAFIFAIQNGHKEIVELLLDRGANPNQALLFAAQNDGKEIFNLLLEKGADPNQARIWKKAKGDKETVESLLRYGADFRNNLKKINKLGLSDLLHQCQNIENCAQQINVKIAETNNFSQNAINNLNPLIYRSLCKNVFISSDPQSINNSIELINSNQDLIAENLSSNIEILRESKSTSTNDNIEVKNNFDHLNQDNVSIINEVIGKFFNAQNTQTNKSENTTSEESGSVKVTSFGKLNGNERSRE